MEGGKGPISGIQSRPLYPKQVVDGWDHLMHARKIGKERPRVVPVGKRERKTHGRIKWIRICCGTGSGRERKN